MKLRLFWTIGFSAFILYLLIFASMFIYNGIFGNVSELFSNLTFTTKFLLSPFPALLIVGLIVFISDTRLYDKIFAKLRGLRKMLPSEKEKLVPIFQDIKQKTGIEIDNFDFYVQDSQDINAFAMSNRTIAYSYGTLTRLNSDGLKAITCHEIGHIVHGDTQESKAAYLLHLLIIHPLKRMITNFFFIFALIFSWIFPSRSRDFLEDFEVDEKGKKHVRRSATLDFFNGVGQSLLSKKAEFRADEFAVRCGYGKQSIDLFEWFMQVHSDERTWFGRLFDTHPTFAQRIQKIHDLMAKNQNNAQFYDMRDYFKKHKEPSKIASKVVLYLIAISAISVLSTTL